jgi:hypothetical protein
MNKVLGGVRQSPAQLREMYGDRERWIGSGDSGDGPTPPESAIAGNRFVVADGTLEALKWLALVLMLLDHINKYFYAEQLPGVFALGRIVMPIFGFVLVYNLARPGARERGVHRRMLIRLALTGLVAAPIVTILNGTLVSHQAWWPLNILFTLLTVVVLIDLIERGGGARYAAAAVVFVVAGAFIEYLWAGVLTCLGAWAFCRQATATWMMGWFLGVFSLTVINLNAWALLAIPVILIASRGTIRLPRSKWAFYAFYPGHLALLLLIHENFAKR